MTTTMIPASALRADPTPPAVVTQRSVVRAEWRKFTSVRSNVIAAITAGVLLVVFGTLFSSMAGSGQSFGPGQDDAADAVSMALSGSDLSLLVIGVLSGVFVAGEYTTGMIRSMFAAVARRSRVLWAKAIVLGTVSWAVMTVASVAVFFTGRAVYDGDGPVYALGDPGVLRAVLGTGLYGAGVAVIGLSLGFVVRSTAATIATLVAGLMVLPGFVSLSDSLSTSVGRFMPSMAGQAFLGVTPNETLLSPGAGLAVFVAWVFVLLAAAIVVLKRRDA